MSDRKHILVVDDDPEFRDFAEMVLEGAGFDVALACNAVEARKAMAKRRPDVLVLDVMMDMLDAGFQFLWDLKGDPDTRDIPVVIATGLDHEIHYDFARRARAEERDPEDMLYLPVTGYLTKPVRPEELVAGVEAALGEPAAGRGR